MLHEDPMRCEWSPGYQGKGRESRRSPRPLCGNKARYVVGKFVPLRLCEACALLPQFALRRRVPIGLDMVVTAGAE